MTHKAQFMGKRIAGLALCLLFIGVLAAYGSGAKEGAAKPEEVKPVLCKIAHSGTEKIPRHLAFVKFKELVEAKSNGRIKVEIYPQGQLGTEAQITEQVKLGTIQATITGSFEQIAPELLIYTMPFLFSKIEGLHKVTRGSIGDKIAKAAEKNGFAVLATGDSGGFRNLTNNVRPITRPADMKGLKMRTPPIETIIKTMEALGANPVSIPYVEVYMALKTGVADGEENPYINILNMKFHEVQKYMTVVNYQWHPAPFTFSLKWYNSLSADLQKIVQDAAKEVMVYNDELSNKQTDEAYDAIKGSLAVNILTEEQRKLFIDAVKPVYDYYINKGLFKQEDLEEIRRVAGS
jgi:C4-dicarboxylate-binding protein DctP